MPKPSESQTYQIFRSRIEYLTQHTQLVDAVLAFSMPLISDQKGMLSDALGTTATAHPRLSALPTKNRGAFHNHSKRMNGEYLIHLLYSYFDEYVSDVINALHISSERCANLEPLKSVTITVSAVLAAQTAAGLNSALATAIKNDILNEKSSRKKLERLEKLFGLPIDKRLKADAFWVLDVRNALVHDAGVISVTLQERWGRRVTQELSKRLDPPRKNAAPTRAQAQKLTLTAKFLTLGPERIAAYLASVDASLVKLGLLKSRS